MVCPPGRPLTGAGVGTCLATPYTSPSCKGRPEQSRWLFCHHLLKASVAPYCLKFEAKFLSLDLRGILGLVYLKDLIPHCLSLMKCSLATPTSSRCLLCLFPGGPKPLPLTLSAKGHGEAGASPHPQTKCLVSLCSVLATGDIISAPEEW